MKGFVPTPEAIVDMMSDKLFSSRRPTQSHRLLDPGCGSGVFLEGIVRWCLRHDEAVPKCTGVELNPSLVNLAQRRIGHEKGVRIIHADFLNRGCGEFDFIIGNPPYVSIGDLSESQRACLRKRFRTAHGRFDLYLLFMERALESLSPDGRLVFITPEKFIYVATAAPLRRLLCTMQVEEVHLVEESTFGALVTYPSITTVSNRRSTSPTRVILRDGTVRKVTLPADGSSWLPAMNGSTSESSRLSLMDICRRVSCGVATGADSVFVLPDAEVPASLRSFAHPTIAGRHFSGRERAVGPGGWTMLIPYKEDGSLVEERELGPLGSYLRDPQRRAQLNKRTCVLRKPWYAFHENPPLPEILQPKILCKDIGCEPGFVVDEEGALVPRHSVYYIVPKEPAHIHELAAYLNSPRVKTWLRGHCQRAANGFLRLQSHVLKSLPIPERFATTDLEFLQSAPRSARGPGLV